MVPRGEAQMSAAAMDFARAVFSVALAFLSIGLPIAMHGIAPSLGMMTVALVAGWSALRLPQQALTTVLVAFIFQNLLVSLLADTLANEDDFDLVRGYNFLFLAVTWLVMLIGLLARWNDRPRALDAYIWGSFAVFAGIGLYFLFGYAVNGFNAIVYLRNIITPLLLFHVCLVVFSTTPARFGHVVTIVATLVTLCGIAEFFFRDAWFAVTNSERYWELSGVANYLDLGFDKVADRTGVVYTNIIDTFRTEFFNSPLLADLGGTVLRMAGPNMHSISFAYLLSFLLVFMAFRGKVLWALPLFVLLFLTSAKGPLLLFVMIACGWLAARLIGMRPALALFAVGLLVYIGTGIVVGLRYGDYHVIGFMGAVYDFMGNPIGHGIGTGGNLSPQFTTIDWEAAQAAGRTPFAVESSIGVLIYQMGLVAFLCLGFYIWIALRVLRIADATGNNMQLALGFAILAMLANGIFQEEALFSPLSMALYLMMAGIVIGAAIRTGVEPPARVS